MLTDPKLRAQVDALWDKFWTGGLSNPDEPPLDMFGADAVERWFNREEKQEIFVFAKQLMV